MAKKKDNQAKKEAKKQRQEEKASKKSSKAGKALFGGDDIDSLLAEFAEADKKKTSIQFEPVTSPSARTGAAFAAHPDAPQCFLFGGEHFDGRKVTTFNDAYVYYTGSAEWKKVTIPHPPPPRTSAATAVVTAGNTSTLYMCCGDYTSPNQMFKHYSDLWSLDLNTLQWAQIKAPGCPSARSGHRIIAYKRKLYCFGGFYDNHQDVKYFDDLHVFDLETMTWTKVDSRKALAWPKPRSGFGFVLHEGTGTALLYGGYSTVSKKKGSFEEKSNVLNDLWQLNLNTLQWTQLKNGGDAPTPRSGFTMFSVRNRVFMFGGVADVETDADNFDSTFFNELREYNLRKKAWELLNVKVGVDPSKRGSEDAEDEVEAHFRENAKRVKAEEEDLASAQLKAASAWKWGDEKDEKAAAAAAARKKKEEEEAMEAEAEALMMLDIAEDEEEAEDETDKMVKRLGYVWPRRNAQVCVKGNIVYLFGGVFERGDSEVTLDDLFYLDTRKGKLTQWNTVRDADLSHHVWFEDDESDDDDEEEEGDNRKAKRRHESEDEYEEDEDEDDDEDEEGEAEEGGCPRAKAGEDAKKYFERTKEHWMTEAMMEADEVLNDKQMRAFAFKLATAALKKQQQ